MNPETLCTNAGATVILIQTKLIYHNTKRLLLNIALSAAA